MLHHHPDYHAERQPREADRHLREALVQAAAGDERAWVLLTERWAPRVKAVARRHRLSAHDVEDVCQTTWLRLVEGIARIRRPVALGAWLETTARHESLRVLQVGRRAVPTCAEADNGHAADVTSSGYRADLESSDGLRHAVARLPRRQGDLLGLLLTEPTPSYAEISRRLGIPVGSIGPTRARALRRLRRDTAVIALHTNYVPSKELM
jgi:RNA polymerase sigma factor (sigma-70 family)